MDDDLAVETRDLTKRYPAGRLVVDRLNLRIRRGEIYGFIGPNGAGKTTTLRMLVGLVAPTSGSVRVLDGPAGCPETLSRVGALIETPTFYPYLSGRDNLRAIARYAGVDNTHVETALVTVKLTDRAGDRFQTYSLGMKQRLGVAAALLKDPALLILDEPTNGLDPAGMADMRTFIRNLGDEGRTVLFSSHQLGDVAALSDRVGIIAGGRLVAEDTVADLSGPAQLLIRAHPLDVARHCVTALVGDARVAVVGGTLRADVPPDHVPILSRVLLDANVAVTEIRPITRSLAEVVFTLTGERVAENAPHDRGED